MANSLTIGIIGYGGFGRFLHHAWSSLDEVRVCAISDVDQGRAPLRGVDFHPEWRTR